MGFLDFATGRNWKYLKAREEASRKICHVLRSDMLAADQRRVLCVIHVAFQLAMRERLSDYGSKRAEWREIKKAMFSWDSGKHMLLEATAVQILLRGLDLGRAGELAAMATPVVYGLPEAWLQEWLRGEDAVALALRDTPLSVDSLADLIADTGAQIGSLLHSPELVARWIAADI